MAVKPSLAKYFPEDIPGAQVVNLATGVPYSIESIARFSKIPGDFLVTLLSFGLSANANVTFYADADNYERIIDAETYGCYHLDNDDDVFIPAKSTLHLKLLSSAIVNNYPIRYLIRVSKPSVLDKILHSVPLTDKDTSINNMYKVGNRIKMNDIPVHRPMLVSHKEIARSITAGGGANPQIGETITIPKNRYIVLDEIAVDGYEAGVTNNFIVVDRDGDNEYIKLNCHSMPPFMYNTVAGTWTPDIPLSHSMSLGIPAVDKLSVSLENGGAVNNWRVRFKYSTYVLTIPDKIRWGLGLTPEDSSIAKEHDLENKVKAGLA